MLKVEPITTTTISTTQRVVDAPDYNQILKEFAKDPVKFRDITPDVIKHLSQHLQNRLGLQKSLELKHILYAGMLLRHFGHLVLESSVANRLLDISGTYLDLEDFFKISESKFYADAFAVAMDNMQGVMQCLGQLWSWYNYQGQGKSGDSDSYAGRLEILAHKYCDSYGNMLSQVSLLNERPYASRKKSAAIFLMDFPFRNHLVKIGVPSKSREELNNSYIYAMLYLTGLDDHKDQEFSAKLQKIVRSLLEQPSNMPYIQSACRRLLREDLGTYFADNLLPIMLACLKHKVPGDGSLGLLRAVSNVFYPSTVVKDARLSLLTAISKRLHPSSIVKFDQMLTQDLRVSEYESCVLTSVHDLGLGLRNVTHTYYQIIGFVDKYGKEIDKFIDTYRRNASKESCRKYIQHFLKGSVGFCYIATVWENSVSISDAKDANSLYRLGLDPKVKRQLACMDFNSKELRIDAETMTQILRHIIIVSRLTYEFDFKKDKKTYINTDEATYASLYQAAEQMLATLNAPAEVTKLTIEPMFKSKLEPSSLSKGVDAVIYNVGNGQWIFWAAGLSTALKFSSSNISKMVLQMLTICKAAATSESGELGPVQGASIVFYPKNEVSALVFTNRKCQTPFVTDSERVDGYDLKKIVKSDSSPNFGSVKFGLDV